MPNRRAAGRLGYITICVIFTIVFFMALFVGPLSTSLFGGLVNSVQAGLGYNNGVQLSQNGSRFSLLYYNAPKPQGYSVLINYMLTLINNDRQSNGISTNVSLDFNPAAQQHAYSMLVNSYFSHWDTQGYKPYMRYTIAGGNGSVEENVAYEQYNGRFTSLSAVEDALKQLEYQMVYNDSAHQNGHRFNILDPYHNYVSIGIAYDINYVYLVQDFENEYIHWNYLPRINTNDQVALSGNFTMSKDIQMVEIFYDPIPQPLTPSQLANSPYNDGYDQGTFLGGVVPYGFQVQGGATVTASQWSINSNSFFITFSMANLVHYYGDGVYTLYVALQLNSGKQETFSSYSFFITNSTT
ncbi:MAG: CAP domain-containing protein [Conexivisphaerales archaeon]